MQQQIPTAAPQRPAPRPAGGRGRAAAAPDPTAQQDHHTTLGSLLLRAERGPDPTERLLAVTRVVLFLATDPLRPGTRGFADTPTVVLGQHYLSRRQLAERHRGDAMHLFLQELASHEPLAPTQHAKYASSTALHHPPAGPGAGAAPAVAATLAARLRPAAAARQQQAGLLEKLGAGGKAAVGPDGAPAAWLEVAMQGEVAIVFPRHAETYLCTLPTLVLASPLAEACPLDLAGDAWVSCEATGLSASLHFRPFRGGRLRGSVTSLLGEGRQEVASIAGSWQGIVTAESSEGSGVLFDASQLRPALAPAINLAEPGPRAAARLWVALLEAAIYTDATAAAKEGKRAAELVAALPAHLRRSLLYEMESSGLKPKQAAAAEEEAQAQVEAAAGDPGAGVLPPCVLAQRSVHGGLAYQLHYRVQSV